MIRIRGKAVILLAMLAFCVGILGKGISQTRARSEQIGQESVPSAELVGYLEVIPLSPDETRALILPELGWVLTGRDVRILFEKLGLEHIYGQIAQAASLQDKTRITREQWGIVYEQMLDKLGLQDTVEETVICYLGRLEEENRIITDSGNYDCEKENSTFVYGETYTVYRCGNCILGRKASGSVPKEAKKGEAPAQTASGTPAIPAQVRVLLTQDNGQAPYRSDVQVKSDGEMTVTGGGLTRSAVQGEVVDCTPLFDEWQTETITIRAQEGARLYLASEDGTARSGGYRGSFWIYRCASGFWVVNELGMEEYLYGVLPGEMPQQFAAEALKAQAVCARTYACRQIAGRRYEAYAADLDDTTDCQVYVTDGENEKAVQAVDDTKGQVLFADGDFARVYYFSTSCGYTSGLEIWQEENVPYLTRVSLLTGDKEEMDFDSFIRSRDLDAYDSESRFFRWTAYVSLTERSDRLRETLGQYLQKEQAGLLVLDAAGSERDECAFLGTCRGLAVQKRTDSGMVAQLELQFDNGTAQICQENTIRAVLAAAMVSLEDKNGTAENDRKMLPSAAFAAEGGKDGVYCLYGGGLGHGIGMSQYGADGMAASGMTCGQILSTFFPGTTLENFGE